jgi:Ca-activated chloride channel family protein
VRSVIVVVAVAVAVSSARAQAPQFRSGVDAVRVDVLVTDGRRPVADLTAADFEILDSGIPQSIDAVAIADVPISMMIALDLSDSVKGDTLDQLKKGVDAALAALEPRDRAALVTFASDVRLREDWTSDTAAVRRTLADVRAAGGTSLWDAAFAALAFQDTTPTVRRLVLVFSDGDDTSSWLPRGSVVEKARRTEAVVYSVEMTTASDSRQRLHARSGIELSKNDRTIWISSPFLQELADATGGDIYRTRNAADLRAAFARILSEFRTRYLLTYSPQGVDKGGWHPIEVKLKSKKGKVTARRGYLR